MEANVTQSTLRDLEEYSPEKFVVKPVYSGARSKAMLLHLLPGQEVPIHPHPDLEVILFPQRGEATLVWDDGRQDTLRTGVLCDAGVGPTFGLQNTGMEPFQTLVTLVSARP